MCDLSQDLLNVARSKIEEHAVSESVEGVQVANAIDLSAFDNTKFDAALSFGPYYHLTGEDEREQARRELFRVLKPGGRFLASFLPRISGLTGLIDRAAPHPEQVTTDVFAQAVKSGAFHNGDSSGCQESSPAPVRPCISGPKRNRPKGQTVTMRCSGDVIY
ncbi:TPA: hypothetical protein DCE37_08830 [Candidatus Latescibacteria bacterium]|nr:hypothetical protein [Candidatus Latescibacterota bacterium]